MFIFDVLCFFQALAEALKTNSSVRDMNLEWNQIGPEGAQARPVSDVLGSLMFSPGRVMSWLDFSLVVGDASITSLPCFHLSHFQIGLK